MMPQQISKKILIYLFIFFIFTTVTNPNLSYNFYEIKKFDINGLNLVEKKNFYDDLKFIKNSNIFLFNKKNISKIIYSNKTVEKFEVNKIYPSTLNIKIKKTKLLALTKKNNINYFVGANGNLIETKDISSELPFIFGNININNFLYFKEIVDTSNFEFNNIKNLYYFKSNRWDILTKGGLTLKMPVKLNVEKLNLIFKVINKNNLGDVRLFDFRQNNMLVTNE